MKQKELEKIIKDHKFWLNNEEGKKADLSWANLSRADLSGADLSWANLSRADLSGANLRRANLSGADLSRANLIRADLSRANIIGANLDFSSWPLWCGSIGVKIDDCIAKQLVYHAMCNLDKKQMEEFLSDPIAYANGFHRVGEVPKIGS